MALRVRAMVLRPDQFTFVWNDKGSGSVVDVAIWRPNPPDNFFCLGDHAESGVNHIVYSTPSDTVIVLEDISTQKDKGRALASPEGFERIWVDRGSGADRDVSIWRPKAPNGYVALGYMSGAGFDVEPYKNHYVCVHHSLVRQGVCGAWIWSDKKSEAQADVSLWRSAARSDLPDTIGVGTFIAVPSHAKPKDESEFDNLWLGAVVEWVPQ